tara:strand:- start:125 stop:592 length:468 start_codon:yes stop_codon:yes gene_type:complete
MNNSSAEIVPSQKSKSSYTWVWVIVTILLISGIVVGAFFFNQSVMKQTKDAENAKQKSKDDLDDLNKKEKTRVISTGNGLQKTGTGEGTDDNDKTPTKSIADQTKQNWISSGGIGNFKDNNIWNFPTEYSQRREVEKPKPPAQTQRTITWVVNGN